jgi:hypothetical protein
MATKRRLLGRKRKTAKFRKQNKTKGRKSAKLAKLTKSKRYNKKRKYNTKRRFRLKGGAYDGCSICGENFEKDENNNIIDDIITLNCGHKFHRKELIKWCQTKRLGTCTCPIDRINISEEMEQYMPQNVPQNDNHSDSDSNTGTNSSTLDADIETLENFIGETASLLHNMPYVPLPETPYLDGVDLPVSVEGGDREKIKNMLICLFANENYFWNNFFVLNGCNIMEVIDVDDDEGVDRLKIALITDMMNLVNNNRNYSDDQLRHLIGNYLEICAANFLMIIINPSPNLNI